MPTLLAASVNCITNNGNIALSGCDAGVLKLWRLADGQLADSVPLYDNTPAAVTAVECIGPLLVSAALYALACHLVFSCSRHPAYQHDALVA